MSESQPNSANAMNPPPAEPSDLEAMAARLGIAPKSGTTAASERTLPFGFTIVPITSGRTGAHAILQRV